MSEWATLDDQLTEVEALTGYQRTDTGLTTDLDGVTITVTPHLVGDTLAWHVQASHGHIRGGRGVCDMGTVTNLARLLADALLKEATR